MKRNPNTKALYHFKLNFRLIIHQLRIEAFSTKIRERLGQLPGLIIKIIMSNSLLHGKGLQVGNTEPLTLAQITGLLPTNTALDLNKLGVILEQMSSDQLKSVKKIKQSSGENKYCVSLVNILRHIQLKIIEGLIERQFGDKVHVRVFRAIQALGMANEKQLEETCLLSIKAVRKIVMNLVIYGILDQHEINMAKGIYSYSVKVSGYLPLLRERIMKVDSFNSRAR